MWLAMVKTKDMNSPSTYVALACEPFPNIVVMTLREPSAAQLIQHSSDPAVL